MSGDPTCRECGCQIVGMDDCTGRITFACGHDDRLVPRRQEVSMRPKLPWNQPRYAPKPNPFDLQDVQDEHIDDIAEGGEGIVKDAKDASKDDLEAFIGAYLNDPVFAKRFANCIDMLRRKNGDYTAGNAQVDRVYNFNRAAEETDLKARQVWYVYAWKHWTAIRRYIKEGAVESEPIDGRIDDMINYLVLLGAIVDQGG